MVCLYQLLGLVTFLRTYSLIPAEVTRTTSGRKTGRPKGSKDGPRPPGAPQRGRPSKIPKPLPNLVNISGEWSSDLASLILTSNCLSVLDVEPDDDEYVFEEISQEMLLEMYQLEVEETQRKLNSFIFLYYLILYWFYTVGLHEKRTDAGPSTSKRSGLRNAGGNSGWDPTRDTTFTSPGNLNTINSVAQEQLRSLQKAAECSKIRKCL